MAGRSVLSIRSGRWRQLWSPLSEHCRYQLPCNWRVEHSWTPNSKNKLQKWRCEINQHVKDKQSTDVHSNIGGWLYVQAGHPSNCRVASQKDRNCSLGRISWQRYSREIDIRLVSSSCNLCRQPLMPEGDTRSIPIRPLRSYRCTDIFIDTWWWL